MDPEVCEHRVEWLTTKGSNQYRDTVRCDACDAIISSEETAWWSEVKEKRRLQVEAEKAAKYEARMNASRRTKATTRPITAAELRMIRAEPGRSAGSTGGTGAPR